MATGRPKAIGTPAPVGNGIPEHAISSASLDADPDLDWEREHIVDGHRYHQSVPTDSPLREWSWAENPAEVERRREQARSVFGSRVGRVRYFTLDYARLASSGEGQRPRIIQKDEEWQ